MPITVAPCCPRAATRLARYRRSIGLGVLSSGDRRIDRGLILGKLQGQLVVDGLGQEAPRQQPLLDPGPEAEANHQPQGDRLATGGQQTLQGGSPPLGVSNGVTDTLLEIGDGFSAVAANICGVKQSLVLRSRVRSLAISSPGSSPQITSIWGLPRRLAGRGTDSARILAVVRTIAIGVWPPTSAPTSQTSQGRRESCKGSQVRKIVVRPPGWWVLCNWLRSLCNASLRIDPGASDPHLIAH